MRRILTIPFPMREFVATVQVPRDLSQHEADRLGAMVQTLVIPFKPYALLSARAGAPETSREVDGGDSDAGPGEGAS